MHTDPHYNRYGELTLEGARKRYPRLIHEMQWAANLSETEAIGAILAVEQGVDCAGEAVDHFGGPRTVVEAAYIIRREPTTRRVSRGRALLDRAFRSGEARLDYDWRGRARRAFQGYVFDISSPDRCVLAWSFGDSFSEAKGLLFDVTHEEQLAGRNGDCFYGFELYGADGGIPEELTEAEGLRLTQQWALTVGVVQ